MIGPTRCDWQRQRNESVDVRHQPRVAKYPTRELVPLLGKGEVGHPLLACLKEDGGRRTTKEKDDGDGQHNGGGSAVAAAAEIAGVAGCGRWRRRSSKSPSKSLSVASASIPRADGSSTP